MPSKKAGLSDKHAFGPDMKWSPEAKAKRSAAAKKSAATRARNRALTVEAQKRVRIFGKHARDAYPYYQNSRVARWALSGVGVVAMIRGAQHIRWHRPAPVLKAFS